MYFRRKPVWAFGYGGSYTRFRYSKASVSRRVVPATGTARVSFRVTNSGRVAGATVAQLYAAPPHVAGVAQPRKKLVGFRRTRVLKPGKSQRVTISVPLIRALRSWSARRGRSVVYPGRWRFLLASSSAHTLRSVPVRVTGSIPRTIATLSLAPPQVRLAVGHTLDLRGRNPWLDGLAPASFEKVGDTIVSAVRRDDSFADPGQVPIRFSSNRPDLLRVDRRGVITAVAPGVATVTAKAGSARASAAFVVP
jgi:beta-glucosidase